MLRTFGFIMLALCVIAAIGLYRGWFTVSDATSTSRPGANVSVDQDKVKDDLQKVQGLIVDKLVAGSIRAIDPSSRELRVAHERGEVTLKVTTATSIKRGDTALGFADLKVEDAVSVVYDTTNDTNVARRITLVKQP